VKPRSALTGYLRSEPTDAELLGQPNRPSEKFSWAIQSFIRRWTFVVAYSVLTVVWWLHPSIFGDDHTLTRWMALFSWLAVFIESVVGIGVFSQSKRDSMTLRVVLTTLRKVLDLEQRIEDLLEDHLEDDSERLDGAGEAVPPVVAGSEG
jgi:hypothetical protein